MSFDIPDGLLNALELASTPQDDVWSPIEEMRREQARIEAALELGDFLLAARRTATPEMARIA